MKMIFSKQTAGLEPRPLDAGAPSASRSRKKRGAALTTRNFWRTLSTAALASPHTSVLRRFHD
ncbi:MAG TPA: hypothetical protein VG938_16025 [Verrucomicrobiae bacterium]|jgi:hypothetical protein|nr:hypothetical protein [Verrucomicrobiae bacterium]